MRGYTARASVPTLDAERAQHPNALPDQRMRVRQVTTAWLFHSACCGVALLATPAHAQMTARWESTTLSTWASDGLCASSGGAVSGPLSSSQALGGRLTLGDGRALSASVGGTGGIASARTSCDRRWSALATAQVSYRAHDTRFWVAYAASNANNADTTVRQPGLAAGVERRIRSAIVTMSVGPRRDRTASQSVVTLTRHLFPEVIFPAGSPAVQETVFVADTVTRLGRNQIPDLGLGLTWTRKALGIEAGAHLGLASTMHRVDPLGTLRVTYDVNARLSAIAALTSRAALPARDLSSSQMVTLGFRIRGGHGTREKAGPRAATATEFRVVRDTADRLTIVIMARHAERVEVASDFTQWTPLSLERLPGGWWQLRVRTSPGMHRVSVRVDGGRWNAPPGLSPVDDEFGGSVGMLVVQ